MRPAHLIPAALFLVAGCGRPPVARDAMERFSARDWAGLCAMASKEERDGNGWTGDACPRLLASLARDVPADALERPSLRPTKTYAEGERWFIATFPNAPTPGSDLPPATARNHFVSEIETDEGVRTLVLDYATALIRMGPRQDIRARAARAERALIEAGLEEMRDLRTGARADRESWRRVVAGEETTGWTR